MSKNVRFKRIYEEPTPQDGIRVLVDRLWPRGVSKQAAHLDAWEKEVAPSTELRKWYGHEQDKFPEFRRRYEAELSEPGPHAALKHLRTLAREGPITLLTATKDLEHSEAAVLAEHLLRARSRTGTPAT